MNYKLFQKFIIYKLNYFLEKNEIGILNLICKNFYNKKYKINIDGFILNQKMKKWYVDNYFFDLNLITPEWSIINNYKNCLHYCYKNNKLWDANSFTLAAKMNRLECIKYMYKNYCCWTEFTIYQAVLKDNLEILKFCIKNKCPFNKKLVVKYSVYSNNKKCLEYTYKNNYPIDEDITALAAGNGNIKALKFCLEKNYPISKWVCALAAENGNLKCLELAFKNNCPMNKLTCEFAAYRNNLECLKFAHKNNCNYEKSELLLFTKNKCLDYIIKNM